MKRKMKGFTLMEVAITMAILIILFSISTPIYRDYIYKTKQAEGYMLLAKIRDAQIKYYNEYGNFLDDRQSSFKGLQNFTRYESVLDISVAGNRYFSVFVFDCPDNAIKYAFSAAVKGTGLKPIVLEYNLTDGITYYGEGHYRWR